MSSGMIPYSSSGSWWGSSGARRSARAFRGRAHVPTTSRASAMPSSVSTVSSAVPETDVCMSAPPSSASVVRTAPSQEDAASAAAASCLCFSIALSTLCICSPPRRLRSVAAQCALACSAPTESWKAGNTRSATSS